MLFFVAKGSADACGPGCSEWIAAEGALDAEASRRFRDFISTPERRALPVFFDSSGGIVGQALAIGLILREHRMTAGVGRTVPDGCTLSVPVAQSCRRLMQTKSEHRSRLLTWGSRCLSGCVYALAGGSTRIVARDAQLGVHAVRVLARTAPTSDPPPDAAATHRLLQRYIVGMGVNPALIDAAAQVGPDRMRTLTREEIARFGIESRPFYETPWLSFEQEKRPVVMKAVTVAEDPEGKRHRTSALILGCAGAGPSFWLAYRRERQSSEGGTPAAVRIAAGDAELVLSSAATTPSVELRGLVMSPDFLLKAIATDNLVLTELLSMPKGGQSTKREARISTAGLAKAAEPVERSCRPNR
ncbi:MAG: hypothetical protein IT537_01085 [Hyphomicrobiales bacterium]|nr:hypothetical protein [Hyphomicrobiales bacterium]